MDFVIAAHKRVEQALQYLTVIAERTMEGIIIADLSGAIQFVNTAWAMMHGYENRHQLIGKQLNVFHTKEQMEIDVIPFIEEVKRRGQLTGPVDHIRRNGKPFPTETSMVIFKDQVGKAIGLICFATDITEQQRIKNELKQYRTQLDELVKQQTSPLKAANEQLQSEIAEQKLAEQYFRQQIDELRVVNKQLQKQINELSARSNITETDAGQTTAPIKTTTTVANDEESILVNVFKENIALQKPELVDVTVDKSIK